MDAAAVLVAQFEVGHGVARRGNVVENGGPVIGLSLGHHNDMIQQHIRIRIL